MFAEVEPDDHTAETLQRSYRTRLREIVERVGVGAVVEATELDRDVVEGIATGGDEAVTLTEATAVLAVDDGRDSSTIEADARDRLLVAMSSAVLDVDSLRRGLGRTMTAKELQAKIEGRQSMTLAEYAEIAAFVAGQR